MATVLAGPSRVSRTVTARYFGTGDGSRVAFNLAGLDADVAHIAPAIYRSDWQGNQLLYSTARTNLLTNSAFVGGGSAPTSWTWALSTGTSAPVVSSLDGGIAYSQVATGGTQRPFIRQNISALANTTYCLSMFIEAVSAGETVSQCLTFANAPAGTTFTYPVCPGNPSGGAAGVVSVGRVHILAATVGTAGTFDVGIGCGPSGPSDMTMTFSHPQVEVGSAPTGWISTGSPTSVTDYTLHATSGLVTFATAPVVNADITYKNPWPPSSNVFMRFGTGDGSSTQFSLPFAPDNPEVYVNGVPVTPASIAPSGLVTFSVAPTNGSFLTWSSIQTGNSGDYVFTGYVDSDYVGA